MQVAASPFFGFHHEAVVRQVLNECTRYYILIYFLTDFKAIQRFYLLLSQQLVACLGGAVLSGIFTRFVQGYRYFRSGLPDLVVWNSSSLDYRVRTTSKILSLIAFLLFIEVIF